MKMFCSVTVSMVQWRIYRLPGSLDWWLIDRGEGTPIFKVLSYECQCGSRSVNDGISGKQPRSWIEVPGTLYLMESEKKALFV